MDEVSTNRTRKWMLGLAAVVWLAAVGGGGAVLLRYAVTATPAGEKFPQWPKESRLALSPGKDTLVVAIHPRCPCTRASLVELNRLMLELSGRVEATVLAIRPREFADDWVHTDLVSAAQRIPGTKLLVDLDGREASRFGLTTSGQVALYDDRGNLMFNGGITRERGHVGDSPGRRRILALVKDRKADKNESLVFGCSLRAKACPQGEAHVN